METRNYSVFDNFMNAQNALMGQYYNIDVQLIRSTLKNQNTSINAIQNTD